MRSIMIGIFLFLGAITFSQQQETKVIAYYSGNAQQIDNYQLNNITHIIHCFSHLKGSRLHLGGQQNIQTLRKLVSLKKKHPKLKVLVSLGGWGGCKTCSEVFSGAENRANFARSVKKILEQYGADGIDLDWEYPAVQGPPGHPFKPADRENFTALLQQLRHTLGNKYILSFAAGGFETYFEKAIEWKKAAEIVDFVNLMSYDLVNGYSTTTGHHTPLYGTPEQLLSVDYGVKTLLQKGVPAHKIIIGLAFYGRIWENVPDVNGGLYQAGKFKENQSVRQIDNLKRSPDYQFLWDDIAKAPYIYSRKHRLFFTYDDKKSVSLKTRYALENGLGGVMFWQLGLDYTNNGLVDTINETLQSAAGKKQ